jgi:transposase InsO family protein
LPEQIFSDNGPQFSSSEFSQFVRQHGIKHYRSAPYHPATNGAVERFVKTFKQAMKVGKLEGKSLQEALKEFLLQYRTTPHTVTGTSPAELFMGRPLRIGLDLLRHSHSRRVEDMQGKQKYYFDKRQKRGNDRDVKIGEWVIVRDFRQGSMP